MKNGSTIWIPSYVSSFDFRGWGREGTSKRLSKEGTQGPKVVFCACKLLLQSNKAIDLFYLLLSQL